MNQTKLAVAAAVVAAFSMTACTTRTYEREVITQQPAPPAVAVSQAPASAPVVVATAPPPPMRQEAIPPAPSTDSVWVPGYWMWANGQYNWVPGRYEAGRVGYQWVPSRWENVNGQWTMTGGAWVRQ
jgi:WXXGXW repeat (2 copies)